MKKFITKSFLFILPLLILSIFFDYSISYLFKNSNKCYGEMEVMNDIYEGKVNSDILIYGSSRALYHFNPKIIEDSLNKSAYNFGIDGHTFDLQYLRHLEYLKYNKKPKTIILSVDIGTLTKRKELYNQDQFLPYMLFNKDIKKYTVSYTGYNFLDYEIPFIRYFGKNGVIKTCFSTLINQNKIKKFRNKGFHANKKRWNDDFEKAKKSISSYKINLDRDNISLFEKFIVECKQNNIELIFIYAPEYYEAQKFIDNKKEVVEIYTDYARKYHILYIDYSEGIISKNRNLFYNAMHLNDVGADVFTRQLTVDLLKNK